MTAINELQLNELQFNIRRATIQDIQAVFHLALEGAELYPQQPHY